jgi:flavin reductase (DIM6/NTAB) family NADH-FMN oxidoreductase RutF
MVDTVHVDEFKIAAGHYATGVVAVTSLSDEGPLGFTCQTFTSLSLDPLLVSFSATHGGSSWPKILAEGIVAINVLSNEQTQVANALARSGSEKFAGVSWAPGENGCPLITGALATIEGSILDVARYGDHDIAIIGVDSFSASRGEPLLYFRGNFGTFASE